MRLFISIDFPQEVINYISLLAKQLVEQNLFEGKLIKPEQLHLTLQFIGDVPEEKVPSLKQALQSISMPSFKACLGSLGVFPAQDHIRIIWLDLKSKELNALAQKVHNVLQPLVDLEDRPFLSHITIARVKKVKNIETLHDYLNTIEVEPLCFTINSFILKESTLLPSGPEYSDIKIYQLHN